MNFLKEMLKKYRKFILLGLGLLLILGIGFLILNFNGPEKIEAGASDNVSGWAWSNMDDPTTPADERTIGWISFNCNSKVDTNGDGIGDESMKVCDGGVNKNKVCNSGFPEAVSCPGANCVDACNAVNYGVNIDSPTGNFSGYAWSENIGWISFAPAGPYPASPSYSACLDFPDSGQACDGIGNYNVGGWARALSYGGGWDGWIKMAGDGASWNGAQCTGTNDYGNTNRCNWGVKIDKTTGDFSGFAWSDMVIGWISFKGVAQDGSPYVTKTALSFNSPPDKPTTFETDWNRCSFQGSAVPTFSWTYSDPDGDPQAAYEVEVDDNSSFHAPKFNHLVNLSSTSYVLNLYDDDDNDWIKQLAWNETYFWRVRVKDDKGNWSAWSRSNESKTDKHASPWVDFTWAPSEPTQKETVEFVDQTQPLGGTTIASRLWTIISGTGVYVDGTDNTTSSPHIQFSALNNTLRLEVTDNDGYSCYNDKDVIVQLPLPEYKEIPPIFWLKNIFGKFLAFINGF